MRDLRPLTGDAHPRRQRLVGGLVGSVAALLAVPISFVHAQPVDDAPVVVATDPADGASEVARDASITIRFSEPVTVAADWFTISCSASGVRGAAVSGGPTTFTLDPSGSFAAGEECEVTVSAGAVSDQDADDPPDTMDADVSVSFITSLAPACGDASTPIHDMQGNGAASPILGATVTVEAVVTLGVPGVGSYVQEEAAQFDADPRTSEGVLVLSPAALPVTVGDLVRITGVSPSSGHPARMARGLS